jgi:hypothetical protein
MTDVQYGEKIRRVFVCLREEAQRKHGNGVVAPRAVQCREQGLSVLLMTNEASTKEQGKLNERRPYPCFQAL